MTKAKKPAAPKVLAIASSKGGSGKTTTAVHIAAALAARGEAVILVDAEPQRNACARLMAGGGADPFGDGLSDILMHGATLVDTVGESRFDNLDVLPSGAELDVTASWLVGQRMGEMLLRKKVIEPLRESGVYSWIIIDTPPALGPLTTGALIAADLVVSPLRASDSDSLAGVVGILDALDDLADIAPGRHAGVIVTDVQAPSRRPASQKAVIEAAHSMKWRILGEWRYRAAFGASQGSLLTVGEWESRSPAVQQIDSTVNELIAASRKARR